MSTTNWTDDLPICEQSGIGKLTYVKKDSSTENMVKSFHVKYSPSCSLYGVLDANRGPDVANFAQEKLLADLCLGQLEGDFTDAEICKKLHEAFENVSNDYINFISQTLMDKITLEDKIEGVDPTLVTQRYPQLAEQLNEIKDKVSASCSIALALIYNSKLFVSNVGDTRALLCRADDESKLIVTQLSVDHTISNDNELQRLSNLGVDIEKLQTLNVINLTRSIGDWSSKEGYKDYPLLSSAVEQPILSTPYVHGGEFIDNSVKFLIIVSSGLYVAYLEASATEKEHVNENIAAMVQDAIRQNSNIEDAAQSVIDKVSQMHDDHYISSKKPRLNKRKDMRLLIRIFNMQFNQSHLKHSSFLNRLAKTNLPPLKMPTARPVDGCTTPNSSTPSTTTPGSASSNKATSPFSHHFSGGNIRSPSPLTMTVTSQYNSYDQNEGPSSLDNVSKVFEAIDIETGPELPADGSLLKLAEGDETPTFVTSSHNYVNAGDFSNSNSSYAGSGFDKIHLFHQEAEPFVLDEANRIAPYVDFTEFIEKMNDFGGEHKIFPEMF